MLVKKTNQIKTIELSPELKAIFEDGYKQLFDRYNAIVLESLEDLTQTKLLLTELYTETKKTYDELGVKNIMIKTELGKTLTDLIKARNSITKDKFMILDKSTSSMTLNMKTLESVAKSEKSGTATFDPISSFGKLNKHFVDKEN